MKRTRRYRESVWILVLVLLLAVSAMMGLAFGSSRISLIEVLRAAMTGNVKSSAYRIMVYSRLPRVLGAMLCGSALAVAGAILQAILHNPLASPNTIGVSNGAGLLVLACSALFPSAGHLLPMAAFLGALLTALLVFALAMGSGISNVTLVLAGVAMSSVLGAGMNCIMMLYPDAYIGASTFLVGGLSAVTMNSLRFAAGYIFLGLLMAMLLRREMNIIALGDATAQSLGMAVGRVRFLLIMTASVLVGAAVSFAGMVAFVGLIVPHVFRFLIGGDNRYLIPGCALGGAAFVTLCDLAARTLFSPYELPVGILLSLVGGPFFIYLIISSKRSGHD
ncbi:MAG: iron ABC transporter permease [Clostridia bacterium]|nr:iron ABC transporter permease [Clostridia bacterium]